ncbi:MAG: hypothetical protein OEW75_00490 [Cyclobacteriaceae bacterium]|nr:hypothetical protein [Cyclobacteriaceae bacterium]
MGTDRENNKSSFFFNNLLKGIIWLIVIVVIFILLKDSKFIREQDWLHTISDNNWLVYTIFMLSEVIFGLIPPEIFMIWSLNHGISEIYFVNVLILAAISYWAGMLGYSIGLNFTRTKIFKKLYDKYLHKYESEFRKFSGFILFVAAVTPIPYSAVCMLVGAIKYPRKYFYLISLTRIMRFALWGFFIYQANNIPSILY